MGSNEGPLSSRPAHLVYLDAFAIERTEVTASAFRDYLKSIGEGEPARRGDPALPAIGVLWRQADGYCHSIGRRLPTEAEWEKAARGTDGRSYPWGSVWDARRANAAEGGPGEPVPVGLYPDGASPYGLLDVSGNVAEWVADYFDAAYYLVAPRSNPLGPVEVLDHGLRGGSWDSPSSQATVFFRDSSHSARANPRVGFRCAATVAPE